MSTEAEAAVRPITVLLPPGVYGTTPAVPNGSNIRTSSSTTTTTTTAATAITPTVNSAALASSSSSSSLSLSYMDRFDKHRRLRRAMAAKEATLVELTRLIMTSMEPPQKVKKDNMTVNTDKHSEEPSQVGVEKSTVNAADTTTSNPIIVHTSIEAEVKYLRAENERLRLHEATRAKEQARLETLVYDLRRELESAGETLREQTAAMKCVSKEVARMGPHRMIKTQREQQEKNTLIESVGERSSMIESSELRSLQEKVKSLQCSLAKEQKRREHFEKRCAELQAISLRWKLSELRRTVEGKNEENGDTFYQRATAPDNDIDIDIDNDNNNDLGGEEEEKRITRKGRVTGSLEKLVGTSGNSVMNTIHSIEETYRMARRTWNRQEKEFKRYIQILESMMARMERNMPLRRLNTATLFNVTIKLVSCEGLLNRRNNGIGCIDPFVVLYSPIGEKVLETLPREDTDSPQFNENDDIVTLKVAHGSPWYILVEVYSRGLNNTRLFLGQAKIPVGLLLSDGVTMGKERQHVMKLRPRDREPDDEIIRSLHRLGQVVFKVDASVVDAGILNKTSLRAVRLAGRLISPKQDGEVIGPIENISEKLISYTPISYSNTMTIRVVEAKGILQRETGINSNPFVIVYDLSGKKELLRTPVVMGTSNPSWNNSDHSSFTFVANETSYEGIIFRVYDCNSDGKDEFLGEACLSREEMYSGKEWHELFLRPRKDEMLMYIRENQNRLGKVIIQCVQENKENNYIHQNKKPYSTLEPIRKIFGSTESSKIVREESIVKDSNNILHPLPIQIYVESCKGLQGYYGEGKICVRVVVPNSTSFITPLVSCTSNPSWSKTEGSTVAMLHPLQPGVIEFHVIEKGNQSRENEHSLGYAQFSILDLFRGGFGKKELELTAYPQTTDTPVRENSISFGSVVISFLLLSLSSEEPYSQNTKSLPGPQQVCVTRNIDSSENNGNKEKGNAEEKEKEEEKKVLKETLGKDTQVNSSPTSLQMRIYVKEGHNLLDCDHSMFNVLGLTNPRVLVWVGPDHVYTVSEKHNTVNPKWTQEEGEVFICTQSTHIIRFEVQDVDVAGFDSMGCATIHASEIIASPGEHNLPVMLDGKQYGTLDVVFTVNDNNANEK